MRSIAAVVGALLLLLPLASARAVPSEVVSATDTQDRAKDDSIYCGWGYTGKGQQGQPVALLANGVRSNRYPALNSAIVTWGCTCEWIGQKDCDPLGYYFVSGMFMGDFAAPVHCFQCLFTGHAANATVDNTTVEATASSVEASAVSLIQHEEPRTAGTNPINAVEANKAVSPSGSAKREDSTVYCGWGYTEKGLRGEAIPITDSSVQLRGGKTLNSAIVSRGYKVLFLSDPDCRRLVGYWLDAGVFQGDFPTGISCFTCYQPPGAEANSINVEEAGIARSIISTTALSKRDGPDDPFDIRYCGWGYNGKGRRGDQTSLHAPGGAKAIGRAALNSAIVSGGCECIFYSNQDCNKNKGYSKQVRTFQGDFEQPIHCFRCSIYAMSNNISIAVAKRSDTGVNGTLAGSCGLAWTEKKEAGKWFSLETKGKQTVLPQIQSARISPGCSCNFWTNASCQSGPFSLHGPGHGNLPKRAKCFSCQYDGTNYGPETEFSVDSKAASI